MELFQVSLFVGVDYFGTSMMRSLLPQLTKGASAKQLGSLESAYGVGQVVGSLTLPYLSDSLGRKSILQLSCLGTAVGYGLSAAVVANPALWVPLLISRVVTGLVKQTLTMARAIVGDVEAKERRQAGMALLTLASSFGYLAGPIAGGRLADGWGIGVPMWMVTVLFVALTFLCRQLPETAPQAQEGAKAAALAGEWGWMRERQVWLAFLAIILGEFALTGWTSVARPRISKKLLPGGYSSTAFYDTWLSFSVMLGTELWRRWKAANTRAVMILGNLAFALGLCVLWETSSQRHFSVLYVSALPLGVGISAARTLPAALLIDLAPEPRRGAVMGILDLMGSICRVAAPLVTGFVIDSWKADNLGLALLIFCLLASSCFLWHSKHLWWTAAPVCIAFLGLMLAHLG